MRSARSFRAAAAAMMAATWITFFDPEAKPKQLAFQPMSKGRVDEHHLARPMDFNV